MAKYGWGGAEPEQFRDEGQQFELGVNYRAEQDITITHVRVWRGAGDLTTPGRTATVWTDAGVSLQVVDIPDDLPLNQYSHYALSPYININSGTEFWVSFSSKEYYGAVVGASFDYPVTSLDGRVTARNQALNNTLGAFPTSVFGDPWYAIDFLYAETIAASGTPTLPLLTGTGTGTLTVAGTGTPELPAFTGSGTATITSVESGSGSAGWYGLLSILNEARSIAAEERSRVPVACPNDGEPLRAGARGQVFCPFDGWRPS